METKGKRLEEYKKELGNDAKAYVHEKAFEGKNIADIYIDENIAAGFSVIQVKGEYYREMTMQEEMKYFCNIDYQGSH